MITREDILGHLRAVVAEAGEDYVYNKVRGWQLYVRDGKYDCIAARAFGRLGVLTSDLAPYEGYGVSHVVKKLHLDMTQDATIVLARAQNAQDRGCAWGAVLALAEDADA